MAKYMLQHKKSFADVFNDIDSDNSGTITQKEFYHYFKNILKIPISEEDFRVFFNLFDQN